MEWKQIRNLISMKILLLLLSVALILLLLQTFGEGEPGKSGSGDYYSSLTGIQDLARKEQEIVKEFLKYQGKYFVNFYLDDYSETIHSLVRSSKRLRGKYKNTKYPIFNDDAELEHVLESISANPLMVFKLLMRFTKEFMDIVNTITDDDDVEPDFRRYIGNLVGELNVPGDEDLVGAAKGLLLLQDTYQLPTKDMSNGRLIDKRTGCKLTAFDMYYIGMCASNDGKYATGVEWLYHAHQRILQGDTSVEEEGLKVNLKMISDQHNKEFLSFKANPSNLFSNWINGNMSNIPNLYIPPPVVPFRQVLAEYSTVDLHNFYALCRGETLRTPEETKTLRCWYSKGKSAYHLVSPFKVEMYSEEPPVFQIYELISDSDINQLKEYARPNLKRAYIKGNKNDLAHSGERSDLRTSSVAWLFDRDRNMAKKVPSLIERMTGLVVEPISASEYLQISCYGSVGGYYTVHLDALYNSTVVKDMQSQDYQSRGDRIATVMFYLSDVELGGGTAFPKVGIAAKPIKGSAVLWYNLNNSGEKELLMLHGGCPVLYGNKWVANKWIRHNDQFQTRKCKLDKTENITN